MRKLITLFFFIFCQLKIPKILILKINPIVISKCNKSLDKTVLRFIYKSRFNDFFATCSNGQSTVQAIVKPTKSE